MCYIKDLMVFTIFQYMSHIYNILLATWCSTLFIHHPMILYHINLSTIPVAISIQGYYTPAQRSWRGGILDSPRPSVCPFIWFRCNQPKWICHNFPFNEASKSNNTKDRSSHSCMESYTNCYFRLQHKVISVAQCKATVFPLLTHWRNSIHALNHGHILKLT